MTGPRTRTAARESEGARPEAAARPPDAKDGLEGWRGVPGACGSRSAIPTPALVLDLDALDRNILRMAQLCAARGVTLRPHAKAHKSVAIAERQVASGATGLCCATLGEAEVLARAGIPGIIVTAPLVTADKIDRLVALRAAGREVGVVADDPGNVDDLARAAGAAGVRLTVLVDVEAGSRRTGVVDAEDAVALARRIAAAGELRFAGIQAYDGGAQGIAGHDERRRRVQDDLSLARTVVRLLAACGLPPGIVSGGGTGSHDVDLGLGLFSEIQPGSYVFMDSFYRSLPLQREDPAPFEPALFVRCTVTSASHRGFVTTDAGLKALAPQGQPILLAGGAPPGAAYATAGDEHGRITFAKAGHRLNVGDAVECLPPYCATTVGLYDAYHCVRGDAVVGRWPVDARGF